MILAKGTIQHLQLANQNREVRLLDKNLVKHENFSLHSPDVGTYDPPESTLSGPKFSLSKFEKFYSPKQSMELIKHCPHAYASIYSERQIGPKNYSNSSLPKQQRFRFRDLLEKESIDNPSPLNYNLSGINSIGNKVKVDLIKKINQKRFSKLSLSFSRFQDKAFYHEKERLMKGIDSVCPTAYDPLDAFKSLQSK